MRAFTYLDSEVVPLDRADVDTDAIIPKQFMKSIARTGFGANLFDAWRYRDPGHPGKPEGDRQPDPDFVLNQPRYRDAHVLLARANFGCGSSREHALWALADHGIRAIIAPSFADIFHGNCLKNGVLPVVLPAGLVDRMFADVFSGPGYRVIVDLDAQLVRLPDGTSAAFEIDAVRKHCLLNGLDDISVTLDQADDIRRYEIMRKTLEPWLFG
ncbi:MAG: 3-isopropylmalate dehydratase small subunit [Gammaproteobacteria bacterium]|jgi:3-isopropylmalate/(R)-2-methylmalate dehydratase small subunit|nr:3-isopropylmalate dehydratase small subunit [Gammaproteobacteria bacterium]MBU0773442.1 3-isopropylmalate dehydratase small subunit [Gammaproteobacteria bacterium]MBU0856653.1 3-isopropylmalate dehydratase small subunit [Gammaproteobacteria bacterium]MBU1846817.1 3-isopropylmalate dehydratase small subunit [Gammaproteobacteria bacterium]